MSATPKGLKGRLWGVECDRRGYRIPCAWCGRLLRWADATVDHEPALAEGGSHDSAVLACDDCNQERSRKTNERCNEKRKPRGKPHKS